MGGSIPKVMGAGFSRDWGVWMRACLLLTAEKGPSITHFPRVGDGGMTALELAGEGGWLCHSGLREPSPLLGPVHHGLLGPPEDMCCLLCCWELD